jgi:hypothetical protein
VEYSSAVLADVLGAIAGSRVFVRAAVEFKEGSWVLRTSQGVVGAKPPRWSNATREYTPGLFVAHEMSGDELAGWFTSEGAVVKLASRDVRVDAVHDNVSVLRQPSRARHDLAPLPWPSTDFTISGTTPSSGQGPQGFLVGDNDCPSFPDYQTAFFDFFYGRGSNIGAHSIPQELARIRLVQTDAWLHRVRISPSRIAISVRGDRHEGARLEVNGETLRASKRVGKTGEVTLSLPEGLPDDAYLYLSRDSRWLDYRVVGARVSAAYSGGDRTPSGVTFEVPDDPASRVQALLVAGEGPRLEYKSVLPGTGVESKRTVFKTVAAFANGSGGTLVFGVDPDELTLIGIESARDAAVRDRLGDLIRGIVVPTPDFHVESADADGKSVVIVTIAAGASKPYGIQFGNRLEFYVRRGASTYPATQGEIRAAALSTVQVPDAASTPWRLG